MTFSSLVAPTHGAPGCFPSRLFVQIGRQIGVGPGKTQVRCALVCHRQQATDAPRDGILRHRRIGMVAELVEARVAEAKAQRRYIGLLEQSPIAIFSQDRCVRILD